MIVILQVLGMFWAVSAVLLALTAVNDAVERVSRRNGAPDREREQDERQDRESGLHDRVR